jgi:pre-mRNA-processing factor 39
MSDFNYGGTDEESAEIKKLNAEVVSDTAYSPTISSRRN